MKKITLKEIGDMLAHVVTHMATKDDIAELKGDIVRVQEQVTSIEGQLSTGRYESRVTKLENEVFGSPRH